MKKNHCNGFSFSTEEEQKSIMHIKALIRSKLNIPPSDKLKKKNKGAFQRLLWFIAF
jgi:hypothetical protein